MTPAQYAVFKSAILTNPMLTQAVANGQDGTIADAYNEPTTHKVWRTTTDSATITEAIVWANLTPSDAADGTTINTNRFLNCQAKQINLQILLQGKEFISSNRQKIRDGFEDCLTRIPSGANGSFQSAGWTSVKSSMTRTCTEAEKLFAVGAGTSADPASLTFEGTVTATDVSIALRGAGNGNV